MSYNKAFLIGNITKKPEMKTLPSGAVVTSFSIAENHVWYDKVTNQKKEEVQFHNIVAFGTYAKNIATYFDKGDPIFLTGRISNRSWEVDGVKKYRTEIVLGDFQFIKSGKKKEGGEVDNSDTQEIQYPESEVQYPESDTFDNNQVNPDDIPF